jgi:hypothetical protein
MAKKGPYTTNSASCIGGQRWQEVTIMLPKNMVLLLHGHMAKRKDRYRVDFAIQRCVDLGCLVYTTELMSE